jgi:hypothetical protein
MGAIEPQMSEPISIKEAARRLGVKPKEIRKRIKAGQLDGMVRLPGATDGFPPPLADNPNFPGNVRPPAPTPALVPAPAVHMVEEPRPDLPSKVEDQKDAQIQRLEEMVHRLQDDVEARRREVQELHTLLQEYRRTTQTSVSPQVVVPEPHPAAPVTPMAPEVSTANEESEEGNEATQVADAAKPAAQTLPQDSADEDPDAELVTEAEEEPPIDWQAYDAESDHLRASMGRLQHLLEQLDDADEEEDSGLSAPEPSVADIAHTAPVALPAHATAAAQSTKELPQPSTPNLTPVKEERAPAPLAAPRSAQPRRITRMPAPAARLPATTSPAPEAEDNNSAPTGEAILKRREAMGVSRETLAAASGLSWGLITEVERGRRRDPRSRERVSEALDAMKQRAGS